MIDHLRRYDTEANALADPLVAAYRTEDGWDTSRVIPGCRVYTVTGTTTDGDGNTVETREYLPYWYLWLAVPAVIEALRGKCIIIADREKALAGQPFIIIADREKALAGQPFIIETLMPPEALALYQIEPVIAGSNYPFGI